eukprot:jgi/Psemu1/296307/fgenesh1_pm.144_\
MVITGIIRPPPDIRVVADRTAMFVAKNGRAFESRILGSAKGKTPKFAFLQTSSPFHAYYEDRIRHFEAGGATESDEKKKKAEEEEKSKAAAKVDTAGTAAASKQPKQNKKDNVTKQKASVMDPVAKALLRQRAVIADHLKKEREKRRAAKATATATASESASGENGEASVKESAGNTNNSASLPPLSMPIPPKPLDAVHVVAPYHLTPTQIETIQLVAQFVAMDGKGGPFLPALVNREWSNPDFAFCQPRNIHFAYFSALVDAYRKIISDFSAAAASTATAAASAEPISPDPKESSPSQEPANATTTTAPSIEEVEEALNDAAYRTEYERELEKRRQNQQQNYTGMEDGEIANAIDWHDFVVVETIDFPIEEQVDVGLSMLPTKTATTTAISAATANSGAVAPAAAAANNNDTDMEESSDDDEEDDDADSNIRVVPSYTPKVVGTFDPSTARAVDPLTGKSVSVADMPEHMRIQLLDPKWAEERKKFQDKQKDSNLVGGDAVVANIARLTAAKSAAAGGSSSSSVFPATAKAQSYGNSSTGNGKHTGGPGRAGPATGAPTAPSIGPATGRLDARQPSGPHPQPPKRPHAPMVGGNGYSAATTTSTAGKNGGEPPASKRQRTTVAGVSASAPSQQQHKVTIAPQVVTRAPPVVTDAATTATATAAASRPTNDATTQPSSTDPSPPAKEEEKILLSADEFIATLGGGNPVVELQIRIPNDSSQQNWNFFGQTLTLTGVDVRSIVKDVKGILSKSHLNGMPPNKIQLKTTDAAGKFLNNNTSLAALNIGPTAMLELKTKQRGGRK